MYNSVSLESLTDRGAKSFAAYKEKKQLRQRCASRDVLAPGIAMRSHCDTDKNVELYSL